MNDRDKDNTLKGRMTMSSFRHIGLHRKTGETEYSRGEDAVKTILKNRRKQMTAAFLTLTILISGMILPATGKASAPGKTDIMVTEGQSAVEEAHEDFLTEIKAPTNAPAELPTEAPTEIPTPSPVPSAMPTPESMQTPTPAVTPESMQTPTPAVTPESTQAPTQTVTPGKEKKQDEHYANGMLKVEYTYNEQDNLQKTTYYNRYGAVTRLVTSMVWDEQGNVLQEEDQYTNRTGKYACCYYTYSYDIRGNCVYSSYTYADGTPNDTFWTYEYDSNGRKIKTTAYNTDGTVSYYTTDILYDTEDHVLGYTRWNAERQITSVYRAVWKNGIRIESTVKDEKGNITNHTTFDPVYGDILSSEYSVDGDLYNQKYSYREDGYEEDWNSYNSGYRTITEYDTEGVVVREDSYSLNRSNGSWVYKSTTIYSEDAAGNKISDTTNADGSRHHDEYDGNDNCVLSLYYNEDGSFNFGYRNEYDDYGHEICSYSLDEKQEVKYVYTYEYDSRGNQIKSVCYRGDGSFFYSFSYEYDDRGTCILQKELAEDGSIRSYEIYTYNEKGNKIRSEEYDEENQLKEYNVFEYDSNGNRIRYTSFRPDGTRSWETLYMTAEDGTEQHKSFSYNSDGTIYKEYDWESY